MYICIDRRPNPIPGPNLILRLNLILGPKVALGPDIVPGPDLIPDTGCYRLFVIAGRCMAVDRKFAYILFMCL